MPHPKYPTTRVAVRLESLGFQISPARYHRIMQVVEVFSGGSGDDANDSAFRPYESPDFDGEMSVLSWKVRNPTLVNKHKVYLQNMHNFLSFCYCKVSNNSNLIQHWIIFKELLQLCHRCTICAAKMSGCKIF